MDCPLKFPETFPTRLTRPADRQAEILEWLDSGNRSSDSYASGRHSVGIQVQCVWGFLVAPVVWLAPYIRTRVTRTLLVRTMLHVESSGVFWYLCWHVVSPVIHVKIVPAYNSESEQIYDDHYSFLDLYVSSFYARFLCNANIFSHTSFYLLHFKIWTEREVLLYDMSE